MFRRGGGVHRQWAFSRAQEKKMRCVYLSYRKMGGGSDYITEIRIPPPYLVIDTIRNKEMEKNSMKEV
jgi:hypothetical protein